MTTRPLRFSGNRLFVNAATAGSALRVECLDEQRRTIPGYGMEECEGVVGNSTCTDVRWKNGTSIGRLAGRPVRLRFQIDRGDLYAFWVSLHQDGRSGGYLAEGAPGFEGHRDL